MSHSARGSSTAVRLLVRYFEQEGVRYVFGIPGGPLMPFYEALHDVGTVRHILAKHEQGAAFMADGYARVRGGLGVCCATTGPGGTNALTGVACAQADSIPVLLLTAQIATAAFGKGAAQESTHFGIDLVDVFKPATKASFMLVSVENAGESFRYALRTAMSGRPGAVHMSFPADLMRRATPLDLVPPERYRATPESFDRAAVREAARCLMRARRPALLVGHGVALSGAYEAVRRLAERLVVPVATTPKAKGALPEDHLLSLGVFGFAGCPQAEAYLNSREVDVLVTVGTSLGELATHTWSPKLAPSQGLIQIDADPIEIGKNYPTRTPIVGDAKTVLTELLFCVERELRWQDAGSARLRGEDWVRDLKLRAPRVIEAESLEDSSEPLKPQRLVRELREALPDDAIVFVDIGNCMAWMLHYFPVFVPGTFHINLGLASMGWAAAAAIGGQCAAPDRHVVAVLGDASFAMNGMEVHTAVEHDLPVIWVVLNNGGHGMVHHGERIQFKGKLNTAKFSRRLDIAGMAEALGARGMRVEKPGELSAALFVALASRKPTVIDAAIDIGAVPPMGLRIETLDRFFEPAMNAVLAQVPVVPAAVRG